MPIDMIDERNRLEYKSVLTNNFEESAVAFLNYSEGGFIIIGIDKHKKVVGVKDIDLIQRQIADKIVNNIQPPTRGLFDILIEEIDGIEVIKIIISSGPEKPYFINKKGMSPEGCLIRVGSANQHLSQKQIDAMYARRNPQRLGLIESPKQNLTFGQLRIYYEERKMTLNEEYLRTLDLVNENGKLNYNAYLLADENGISIRVAKYAGTNKLQLIENEEYGYKCLITATHRVLEKLKIENKTFTKVTYPTRLERNLIDNAALREAFINAVVHTDYSQGIGPVVEIYSDRLTITSIGGTSSKSNIRKYFCMPLHTQK
jgi:predicted HTH transcriptional regulator